MRLRTKARLAAATSSVFLVAALCAIAWAFSTLNEKRQTEQTLADLTEVVAAMKDLGGDYDHDFSARFQAQWSIVLGRARKHLDDLFLAHGPTAGLRSELLERIDQMDRAFQAIQKLGSSADELANRYRFLEARMDGQADAISSRLIQLRDEVEKEELFVLKATAAAVMAAVMLSFIVSLLFYGVLERLILPPIERLLVRAGNIGSGNFEEEVAWTSDDEMGELYASIDQMRLNLKQARADLEAKVEEAQAASRAKSEFVATMSHELRTPLNAVIGFSDLLSHRDVVQADPDMQLQYARQIKVAGEQLLAVINDILDFARIESGKIALETRSFSLVNLFHDISSVFSERARRNSVVLDVKYSAKRISLKGDITRIRQVLYNLVGNAVKFSEGGRVTVMATCEPRQLGSVCLKIAVRDTGIGIEEERLSEIFEPFRQADGSITRLYGGSGLGLAISRSIARAMGGDIKVQSEVGKGSRFEVSFLLEEAADDLGLGTIGEAGVGGDGHESLGLEVMAVDDVDANLQYMEQVIARTGSRFTPARNGREAIELAEERRFDVIFMDLHMPDMDGEAAALRIQEIDRDCGWQTPIYLWTADIFGPGGGQVQAECWAGVITKPTPMNEALKILKKAQPVL